MYYLPIIDVFLPKNPRPWAGKTEIKLVLRHSIMKIVGLASNIPCDGWIVYQDINEDI